MVVGTEPDTFSTLTEPFRGPVVFRFDERISERPARGTMDEAVLVSPRTGNVRVTHGRDKVEVSMGGGFRPGLVYRIRLLPVIKDMFGNALRAPYELVFSTGGVFTASAVAGVAWDRTTGKGMDDLVVTAVGEDSTVYVSQTDSAGIYAFRYLPPGAYQVTAFDDRNRSDSLDRMEGRGTRMLTLSGPDTVLDLDFPVLNPDTTPAVLAGATLLDSLTLSLNFDDFLDPGVPTTGVRVDITREGEGPEANVVPRVTAIYHESPYKVRVRTVADSFARLDSIEAAREARVRAAARAAAPDSAAQADSAAARVQPSDSARAPGEETGDSAQARETIARRAAPARPSHPLLPELPAGEGSAGSRSRSSSDSVPTAPDGSLLPGHRLVLRLSGPLTPAVKYNLAVENVTNLNGLTGGGGETTVERPAPKDTTTARDSVPVGDSGAVRDTVPPDTASAPPDRLRPDTAGVPTPASSIRDGVRRLPFLPGRRW